MDDAKGGLFAAKAPLYTPGPLEDNKAADQPSPMPGVEQEIVHQQKHHPENDEKSPPKEAANKEAANKEVANKEAANKEAANDDSKGDEGGVVPPAGAAPAEAAKDAEAAVEAGAGEADDEVERKLARVQAAQEEKKRRDSKECKDQQHLDAAVVQVQKHKEEAVRVMQQLDSQVAETSERKGELASSQLHHALVQIEAGKKDITEMSVFIKKSAEAYQGLAKALSGLIVHSRPIQTIQQREEKERLRRHQLEGMQHEDNQGVPNGTLGLFVALEEMGTVQATVGAMTNEHSVVCRAQLKPLLTLLKGYTNATTRIVSAIRAQMKKISSGKALSSKRLALVADACKPGSKVPKDTWAIARSYQQALVDVMVEEDNLSTMCLLRQLQVEEQNRVKGVQETLAILATAQQKLFSELGTMCSATALIAAKKINPAADARGISNARICGALAQASELEQEAKMAVGSKARRPTSATPPLDRIEGMRSSPALFGASSEGQEAVKKAKWEKDCARTGIHLASMMHQVLVVFESKGQRKSTIIGSWKPSFFLLTCDHFLHCFDDPNGQGRNVLSPQATALWQYDVRNASVELQKDNVLEITLESRGFFRRISFSGPKKLQLQCGSFAEAEEWGKVIANPGIS